MEVGREKGRGSPVTRGVLEAGSSSLRGSHVGPEGNWGRASGGFS